MVRKQSIVTREVKPITIGRFTLTDTGVDINGRPSFGEWQGVIDFARKAHKAAGWWIADLLRYAEKRSDWKQLLEAITDAAHISEKTAKNLKYIGENIAPSRRRGDVDLSTHSEVAGLHPKEQTEWLEKAATEGWSQRDLRQAIRAARRRTVIEGQATLEGQYRVLYADPSWPYGDRPPSGMGAEQHYPTMTVEEIARLPIAPHTMKDAVLFMWTTAPTLLQNPGPREVGEAWGFTYKQQWIWDKVDRNFGHYSQGNHEVLTIWTRGSCLPDNPHDLPDSVIPVKKSTVHSEKPEEFRRLITKHWTTGPYLELFGREKREGWTVFGNDARLWAEEAMTA